MSIDSHIGAAFDSRFQIIQLLGESTSLAPRGLVQQ